MSDILIPRGMLGATDPDRARCLLAHPLQLGDNWYLGMTDGFRLYFTLATEKIVEENRHDFAPHHAKRADWLRCSPVEREAPGTHPFLQAMQKTILARLWEDRQEASFAPEQWFTDAKPKMAKRMSRQIYRGMMAALQFDRGLYEIAGFLRPDSILAESRPHAFDAGFLLEALRYVRRHGSDVPTHGVNVVSLIVDDTRKFPPNGAHCLLIGHIRKGLLTHGAVLMGISNNSWSPRGTLVVPEKAEAPAEIGDPLGPEPLTIGETLPATFAPTVLSQIMRERHAAKTCGWGCPECQAESK